LITVDGAGRITLIGRPKKLPDINWRSLSKRDKDLFGVGGREQNVSFEDWKNSTFLAGNKLLKEQP
jgi:hypothetical protein